MNTQMSPSTMDSLVPAIIFSTSAVGTFMFATATSIEQAVIGLCIMALCLLVCYFEFLRTTERVESNKID